MEFVFSGYPSNWIELAGRVGVGGSYLRVLQRLYI